MLDRFRRSATAAAITGFVLVLGDPAVAQQPTGYNYQDGRRPVKPYLAPEEVDPRDVEVTSLRRSLTALEEQVEALKREVDTLKRKVR